MAETHFEPKIVGFFCNWCSYRAADLAGTARIKYPPNVRIVRTMCSGRIDPVFVLKAFADGADGVMIAGCHPGECHYLVQNHKTIRRYVMLRHTLRALGLPDERLRLQWASAAEGAHLAAAIRKMVDEVRALGPLHWAGNWEDDPVRAKALEAMQAAEAEKEARA
jgi:F420-non-reducing hydrogenase iron-sulfur subunit